MRPTLALVTPRSNRKSGRNRFGVASRHVAAAIVGLVFLLLAPLGFASSTTAEQACPRPAVGSILKDPPVLSSQNSVLEVTLHFRYQQTLVGQGPPRYCYVTDDGLESPTLRVNPGDQLIIHFHNDLPSGQPQTAANASAPSSSSDSDCDGGAMNAAVTNLHFHGLTVPPTCHQDDVIRTVIPAGGDFDYRVTIPRDEPPGLYWYHPHPHGYSERQVQGGASGALIVEGLEKIDPALAAMKQRVIVLRDQPLTEVHVSDAQRATWDISANYVPITYPYRPPIIETKPAQKELWRVLNAGADTLLNLRILAAGTPQAVKIVAIDGVPIIGESQAQTSIPLPPGARAEFVVETPKAGEQAQLVTTAWDTGPEGDLDPARPIASIVSNDKSSEQAGRDAATDSVASTWRPPREQAPVMQRKLYFSQKTPNPLEADTSIFYFITVAGQTPAAYRMGQSPNIVLHEGDVEDWTVENRAPEDHVFHIHQIHFRVLEIDGKPVHDSALRDTINLPYWNGTGPYPSVKLRMDFSDPDIVGTFMYHCHILKHEDMGMMGVIQVLPPGWPTTTKLQGPVRIGVATEMTLVAKVRAKNANTVEPGGAVQFTVDGVTTGRTMPVVNGIASFKTSFDSAGTHVISATYTGDHTYDESASPPIKIKVTE